MYDDNVEKCIESIEEFMKAFGISEEDMGVVISPRYDEEEESMKMEYFVKSYESSFKPVLDSSVYTDLSVLEFNNRVYGEWLDAVKENFDEADVVSADPEELRVKPAPNYPSGR